jgi:hypothetical protein
MTLPDWLYTLKPDEVLWLCAGAFVMGCGAGAWVWASRTVLRRFVGGLWK